MTNLANTLSSFEKHFGILQDPRDIRGRLHKLEDILAIAILAVICGADDFTEIEAFGKSKQNFLASFLELPHGIPSHDTFGRVFSKLCPELFRTCFIAWVQDLCGPMSGEIVNIDGKALRHSYDTASGKDMIHMVSAWANKNNLLLGQMKVSEKSNEITAIPKLLELLELKDSLVTIDAMGTQKPIAAKIIDKQADYLLALKGNQANLQGEVVEAFEQLGAKEKAVKNEDFDKDLDVGHGRIEQREAYVVAAKDYLSPSELNKWKNIKSIIMIVALTSFKNGKKKGQKRYEKRYYISSLAPTSNAKKINHAVRAHWGIETKVHWVLDVAFREDDSRIRTGHADENFAIIRHIALNKLKNEKSCKKGIKAKRKKAGWNQEYMLKVLNA